MPSTIIALPISTQIFVEETGALGRRLFLIAAGHDPAAKVERALYRVPKQTVLTVGTEQITFQAGEHIQFLESRRFLESDVERQLNKFGLGVIASHRLDNYGLYLCCNA